MEYREWLQIGLDNRWIGPEVCYTHDGLPTSKAEDEVWFEGDDICMWLHRAYQNDEHADQVEENHSPSAWRKPHNDK